MNEYFKWSVFFKLESFSLFLYVVNYIIFKIIFRVYVSLFFLIYLFNSVQLNWSFVVLEWDV